MEGPVFHAFWGFCSVKSPRAASEGAAAAGAFRGHLRFWQAAGPTMAGVSTVLVVDDEPIVRDVVVRYLERDGFSTLEAANGDDAQRLLELGSPALVVLDVMLPGIDGLELCRWIRRRSDLPIVMLTARGEEADRDRRAGAGSRRLPHQAVLAARAGGARAQPCCGAPPRAAPRRADTRLRRRRVDPVAREVRKGGERLDLTLKEFDLLHFMASNPRQVFSRDQLMDRVWDYRVALDTGGSSNVPTSKLP